MPEILPPPNLAGSPLDRYFHACAFFHDREEAYQVLGPFIVEGLNQHEKALHITNPELRGDHCRRLSALGLDVAHEERQGSLEVMDWIDAYLQGGRFDPDAMLDLLEKAIERNRFDGYPRTRIIGDMDWALEDRPGVDLVMEYEARVNVVLARHRQPAVCMYDITRIDALTMLNLLRTHPLVIIGGTLSENPFFVPPDEFVRSRKGQAGGNGRNGGA